MSVRFFAQLLMTGSCVESPPQTAFQCYSVPFADVSEEALLEDGVEDLTHLMNSGGPGALEVGICGSV